VTGRREYARGDLIDFLTAVAGGGASGRVYLVGETSQLLEGWCRRVNRLALAVEPDFSADALRRAVHAVSDLRDIAVVWESPGDVIPLPDDYEARSRDTGLSFDHGVFAVSHFDPYSVALRAVARGDEPDYRLVLGYLRHGWIEPDRMDALLEDVLPRFTNETISQDPAEFRRKYKGLMQMWRAEADGQAIGT